MVAPRTGAQNSTTYVGWRHEVLLPDPGPPPRRPAPSERERVSAEWVTAQRRSEAQTNRPLKYVLSALAGVAGLFALLWPVRILPGILVLGGVLACLAVALPVLTALLQSRRVMRERVTAEERRIEGERAEREHLLREQQEEHARRYTEWQNRKRAYEAQPRWYGVTVPEGDRTVLVSGGTDAGWSAVLTTIGASRMRGGGALTVVDLSGRAVTRDLTSLTEHCGVASRIWVLPAELPGLYLGGNLGAEQRARILSSVVRAFDPKADLDADQALLRRLFEVVGAEAGIGVLIGGLRALTGPDGTWSDDPAVRSLTPRQRAEVRSLCGTGGLVAERAWELEHHLAPFEGLGSRVAGEPYAQLKVIATDRVSGGVAARAYGTYVTAALSELLDLRSGKAPGGTAPWAHTVVVCGADALPAVEVDRVVRSARQAGVGMVLMFRGEEGGDVVARFADDGCFPVVMRQPSQAAERVASRLAADGAGLGESGNGLRMHRITEVIGEAVSDAVAGGHDSSAPGNPAEAETAPVSVRPAAKAVAPLDLVRHVRSATNWGRATTQAAEIDAPRNSGSVREFRLDTHGLRTLPTTAMLVPGDGGLVLADANPGILTLPTATLGTVEEAREGLTSFAEPRATGDDPPANLGPPPERLDWRRA